jgi:uncharacterized protein (DUF58 family)
MRVVNSKWLPVLCQARFYVPGALTGARSGQWIGEEAGLLGYQRADFFSDWHPSRRGVYDLGPPELRGGDLFGFFFQHKTADKALQIIVYPRIVDIQTVSVPKKAFYGIPGSDSPVEDPVNVFGTRDYQPGSPSRRIHWKASARHHCLQEKLCEPAAREKVLLLLDVDRFDDAAATDAFERCLEVMASLILQMDRRGMATGFATNARIRGGAPGIIPVSRSPARKQAILEALARADTTHEPGPVLDVVSAGYRIPCGVSCLYFACHLSGHVGPAVALMKRRRIPARFVLSRTPHSGERPAHPKGMAVWDLDGLRREGGGP